MKFALHFGNIAFSDPEGARRLVRLTEAAGFDSVFAVEHVVFPDNYTSVYPYAPGGRLPGGPSMKFPDPLIWLTWVAAATTRLRFMTAVMILPQRNPLVLAKEVATLDYLSGGRIELGIGVGWLREEFEALGIPFERRGKRADEYVAAMRALWASQLRGRVCEIRQGELQSKAGREIGADRRRGPLGSGRPPRRSRRRQILPLDRCPGRHHAIARRRAPFGRAGRPRSGHGGIARRAGRLALPVMAFLPDLETTLARFGEEIIKPYASA
jgi:alkanesulfonate monooxygenase SsuD/methylene tetrahydromethanopterin reductase-like flavin-dependent oxidoreductase (luciferase family)